MIPVSNDFETESKSTNRNPEFDVLIDWDNIASYISESNWTSSFTIERTTAEPLGGVVLAQADVVFINEENRYNPQVEPVPSVPIS